ncbi:MAG: ethanolamine ammonia-lyase [Proteobacteria bacterium]|nr:MAG: ethanolamine ammonia-lyase [Pseudomonadota bacterium]
MSKLIERNPWSELQRFTPARIALGRAGNGLPTVEVLRFGLAHAQARDAVHLPFSPSAIEAALVHLGMQTVAVHSAAADRVDYLRRPDLGRRLDEASSARLRAFRAESGPDLVLVVADGLSALAAHRHSAPVLTRIVPALRARNWRLAPIVIAEQSRVALGDVIGEALAARIVAVLIGERPGLSSPDSIGIYLTYAPKVGRLDSERNCISNIRPEGLGYDAAARKFLYLLEEAMRLRLTGVGLKDDSDVPSITRAD